MEIDPQLPIPLYFQLKTLLLEEILSGRYDPEERLPTEHELCQRYRISRTPVTRALSELADEGVILRHRRRGSFVNPHWLSRRPDQTEIRVIVPTEGPWARMVRDAAGRRQSDQRRRRCPVTRCTTRSRTPSPKGWRPTSRSSTTSGLPSSPLPASSTRSRS